jgi:hypothetical protein
MLDLFRDGAQAADITSLKRKGDAGRRVEFGQCRPDAAGSAGNDDMLRVAHGLPESG